jgi:D-glycero-alpha-D-manno-heptose-7-phosphate kinase
VTCFTFHSDDSVDVEPLRITTTGLGDLEDHLLLFFTGFSRKAGDILADQRTRTERLDPEMIQNLHFVKELGLRTRKALEDGHTAMVGEMMHVHWQYKKRRSPIMSSAQIDEWYELGRKNGAIGGKLVGAGGGGFLLFYAEDRTRLRTAMRQAGLDEVRIRFDFEGTKVLFS